MTASAAASSPQALAVREFLMSLQDRITEALGEREGKPFHEDRFERAGSGLSRPRVLEGEIIERSGVNFSHSRGPALPPAATERRPELAGRPFEAASVSLIVHPMNPYAPTTHANFRYFEVAPEAAGGEPVWWFGGGFDLTPYYGFEEDARAWHQVARDACAPFGDDLYPRFKAACDEYFFLSHRGEPRGIGGVFFDDFAEGDFDHCFALVRSIADAFLEAYLPILDRRRTMTYGERERHFQLMRRGRYVEFNLIHDRGTRFGLQAGGRAESILVSMPPVVHWSYDWHPEPGSPEAELTERFLPPRDWLADGSDR